LISGSNVNGVWVVEYNTTTSKYIRRAADGTVLEERDLTADEVAFLAEQANESLLRDRLAGSQQFDALRSVANGSGTFATAAERDAAIRLCARGLVAVVRLMLRKLDANN
jgi:hypothetical protein